MASRGVNLVILVGHVGQDPDGRFMPSGKAVTNFSLATSNSWRDKQSGETQEATEWHRCVAFERMAEIISEYVRKGSKLYIEGQLRTRSWEKDGITRYATEIVVRRMEMLDTRGGQDGAASHGAAQGSPAQQNPPAHQEHSGQPPGGFDDDFQDDIPF